MSGAKTYKLKHPIQWGEDTITEVKLRRPKGGDLMDFSDKSNMSDLSKLASKLSGLELPIIKELDVDDFMKVMELVGDFFQNSHATGNKQ